MSDQKLHIVNISLGEKNKLTSVRIMVYQFGSNFASDWEKDKTQKLFYPKRIDKFKDAIRKALTKAEEKEVNLVVFPELSVPEEMLAEIEQWSIGKNTIVIAGSHYKKVNQNEKPTSLSPIIYKGNTKGYTQKIERAYLEKGFVPNAGLKEGNTINIYRESPIGDFAVLICSDNLDEDEKVKRIIKKENLDFWIVPAFQQDSKHHFKRMTVDVESKKSRYIIYCNNKNDFSDGKSSFFGQADKNIIEGFIENNYTDYNPEWKLISLSHANDYFIIKVDTEHKRVVKPHVVKDDPNIEVEEYGSLINQKEETYKSITQAKNFSQPKSTEKVLPIEESDNLILTDVNDEDFKILSLKTYKEIIKKFKRISEKPNEFQELVKHNLINDIKKCLDEKGIAFITAPIRFGKSFLLKYIQNEFSDYNFISEINGELLSVKKKEIKSLNNLYFVWFKTIAESILAKIGKEKSSLDILTYEKIEVEERFKDWIKTKRPIGESDIQGFIRGLAEFKRELDFHQDVLVSFHLDDIHKYTDENIFKSLRDDLAKFKNDFNDGKKLTVKILVASRYFPSASLKKAAVNILPYFELLPISILIDFLHDEMVENIKHRLSYLILEKTDGYPWFVIRFFKIYLEERSKGNTNHPLLLGYNIFEDKIFWTMDSVFGMKKESEYLEELIQLIEGSEYSMKENFKKFIQMESKPTILTDGWNNENDFLIRQSGFLKMDYSTDTMLNNGCYIMKKHYKEIIETHL